MMKILASILFGLILFLGVNAQELSRKDFVNTEWFTDNTDSIFYKADTIRLIKYSNFISNDLGFNEYAESEGLLFGQPIYVKMIFHRHGFLDLWNKKYHMSSKSRIGERKWSYNNKKNELIITRSKLIEFDFKILLKREIVIQSAYPEIKNPIKTIELTLVKNN